MMPTTSAYGSWRSPISSKLAATSGVLLRDLTTEFSDPDIVYWSESRPEEKGRTVVCSVDKKSGNIETWTPEGFNVRTTVHEYGGGAFFVYNKAVYFSNFTDQVLYVQKSPGDNPEAITDTTKKWRYADGYFSQKKSRIYSVREDHEEVEQKKAKEPTNTLVAINPQTKTQTVLVSGADFYSCPQVSPDGKQLCWMQWCHPNMPWDSTEIWVADLSPNGDSVLEEAKKKVACEKGVSYFAPGWTEDNELMYVGDQSDWWNLYHVTRSGDHLNVHSVKEELNAPKGGFGMQPRTYCCDPSGNGKVFVTYGGKLGVCDLKSHGYKTIETDWTLHRYPRPTVSGDVYCIAASPGRLPCILRVNSNTKQVDVLFESAKVTVDKEYFSIPESITWKTANDEVSHGYFYSPKNKDFVAPEGTLPPLLVNAHGGPTGKFSDTLDMKIQYFTSRGFAVLTVDYRGSTGYGKKYRHRLRGNWGICDVEDCCSGALYLVEERKVDRNKLCIDGESAGGYTTLACLTFRNEVFKAGTSLYGVSDCVSLAQEIHKYESRYIDGLIAPLTEDGIKVLRQRSPINFMEKLNCPIAFFHGAEDGTIPPQQAVKMHEAIKMRKLPTVLVIFEGEQHGFRRAENIQKALDGEFYFFGKIFGFTPADDHCELKIANLD